MKLLLHSCLTSCVKCQFLILNCQKGKQFQLGTLRDFPCKSITIHHYCSSWSVLTDSSEQNQNWKQAVKVIQNQQCETQSRSVWSATHTELKSLQKSNERTSCSPEAAQKHWTLSHAPPCSGNHQIMECPELERTNKRLSPRPMS